jgi:two-component system, LytTR family, sensor kinase
MKFSKNIVLSIIALALILQTTIISYNAYTGFISVSGFYNFMIRVLIGTVISSIFGLIIIYIDLYLINWLDKKIRWDSNILLRLILEFISIVSVGIVLGISLTIAANIIFPYKESLLDVLVTNTLITIVVNIMLVISIEGIIFFRRSQEAKTRFERLEKETALIKLETLKNQLNPHFLFNSLNVLSALIKKDPDKAELFIEEFSSVYRYTLDVIERQFVTLREELDFANSYFYLQKIRFGESVNLETSVDGTKLNLYLPALAVQIVLENAFKHNRASEENPLVIKISVKDDYLLIENNLQAKMSQAPGVGVGLKNLITRYSYLSELKPEFKITQTDYIAKLPLLNYENESNNN